MRPVNPARLELDYVAAPRRARWLGRALLAAALVAAALQVERYRDIVQERSALAARHETLDGGRRAAPPASARRLEEQLKDAQSVVSRIEMPWPQMIESIEATASPEVFLLQLQPEPERRLLRLTAEAGTPEAMLEYLRRLHESKLLSRARLISHQVQRENPAHPIQFVAEASIRDPR